MTEIQINNEKCCRCGRCVKVCPAAVFVGDKGGVPEVERAESCIACGHCMDVCTGDAIVHSEFPAEMVHDVRTDLLPTPQQLMELIRSRRSNRALTDKPVPEDALQDILEAARYAPTAENSRRVTVTVIQDAAQLQAMEDSVMRFFLLLKKLLMNPVVKPLTKCLLPDLYKEAPELERFEKRWRAGERPCQCNGTALLAFSAPAGYDFAKDDCNLAYQNASLMAESHGVSQIYMGLIQTALQFMGQGRARRMLGLPSGHKVCALMALGMPQFRYKRYTVR